jgi:predicted DNA-binding transcriptional regulator AlpA
MTAPLSDFITSAEAAIMLGVLPRTLSAWRYRKKGPRFVRIGKSTIRYRRADITNYIDARVINYEEKE